MALSAVSIISAMANNYPTVLTVLDGSTEEFTFKLNGPSVHTRVCLKTTITPEFSMEIDNGGDRRWRKYASAADKEFVRAVQALLLAVENNPGAWVAPTGDCLSVNDCRHKGDITCHNCV